MTRILVLGAGVMGTAITLPMADRGAEVRLVGTHLDRDTIAALRDSRIHPRLRAPIHDRIVPTDDREMAAAFAGPLDLVVVGVSTPGIGWAADRLAEHLSGDCPIVLLTKGIDAGTDGVGMLPDFLARRLAAAGRRHGPIGGIGGPCIAGELAVRRETASVIGFSDLALAEDWARRLSTGYYQLRATDDLLGLEICAALKNFYAIGVGTAAGSLTARPAANGAQLHNAAASLFTQALRELAAIVEAAGGRSDSVHGLPGTGDLHVTCQAGRNARLGNLLGGGMRYSEAMAGPLAGETVEGTLVARTLGDILGRPGGAGGLSAEDLPLTAAVIASVTTDAPFVPAWSRFHGGGGPAS
jgi:glycerol-3-phosphate dehydrogenase (NAD(P)+)